MKSFLDHLKEEVLPSVQVADGGLDISKPAVRAAINAAIAGVVSQPAVTPYVVFNRLSKLLAQYHIVLPKRFLEGDKGVEVFELRQFGHKMGMTDSGEFINEVPSTHYLFLQYGILSPFGITYAKPIVGGMFKVMARLVDKAELDKLMDMAEITMAEEAEQMQAIAKANAPKEGMHTALGDCDCSQGDSPSTKSAVATSQKKSLGEEDFNAGQALKNVRDADAAKNPNGPAAMRNKAEDEALERAGKGLARDMKEDKDPCWKGYEMIGMKKKGGRKVPNCVPVEEATDKDRDLSKLASAAMSKGQVVKKLPAGRAQNAVLPKGMAKGANIEKGRWSGHGSFSEEQIDEVKSGQPSFRGDSTKRARRIKTAQQKAPKDPEFWKKVDAANKKRETQIDEVSKRLLGRYIKKAHVSGLEAAAEGEQAYSSKNKEALHRSNKTGEKREQGIERAVNKMTGSARVPANEAYEKQEAGVKTKDGKTHTLHRRNPGHPTEYHTVTTKDAEGKTSVKAGKPKYIKKHWDKLEEKAPPGAKFERMVKHIKKGYAKDGELTKKEKGIAFATAWKAKNREKGE